MRDGERDGLGQSLERGVSEETAASEVHVGQPPVAVTAGQQTGVGVRGCVGKEGRVNSLQHPWWCTYL